MHDSPSFTDCWYLTGATATGKTGVGIELARRIGAEIISLDSMAIYRDMDIGTAKPTPEEREAVPHHLLPFVRDDRPPGTRQGEGGPARARAEAGRNRA